MIGLNRLGEAPKLIRSGPRYGNSGLQMLTKWQKPINQNLLMSWMCALSQSTVESTCAATAAEDTYPVRSRYLWCEHLLLRC